MSLWLDEKYLRLISHRLPMFTDKGNHKFACRCTICGDSEKKKNKRRGGFFAIAGKLFFRCFNCNASMLFGTFLKDFDANLYQEYNLARFKEKLSNEINSASQTPVNIPETKKYIPDIFFDLPLVSSLDEKSRPYLFCVNRKLPIDDFDFYYAENFIEWTHGHTDKFDSWKGKDHPRIIIPWRDRESKIIGYSARALDADQEQKYYRIYVDDSIKEKFFGMDRLDESKQMYVLEGEIDSLMIPNAIAVANGKLHTYIDYDAIYVPDADRRNKHICKGISDMIELGFLVCLIPDGLPGKDLNELVIAGFTSEQLVDMIMKNTFCGLEAKMRFNAWKVVK